MPATHRPPSSPRTLIVFAALAALTLAATLPASKLWAACSKLSIHTGMVGGGAESMTFITSARPTVVKLLGDFEKADDIKAVSPNTVIIGRIFQSNQLQTGDAWQRAQDWWDSVEATVLNYPHVDYWEGYNEPDVSTWQKVQWYNAFEQRRIQLLRDHGRRACIGNFSVGTPQLGHWGHFWGAIDEAIRAKGILCLHEYGAPRMDRDFDYGSGEGWLAGRYRKVYRDHLGGRKIPLAITETGIDGGVDPSPPCADAETCHGWKGYSTPAWDYMNQLAWYDSLLREDDYVIGATVFALQIYGWSSFDISGDMRQRLQNYINDRNATCSPQRRASILEWNSEVPRFMTPYQRKTVRVRGRNNGTWSWNPSVSYRLGSGPGNAHLTWLNFPCGGYSLWPSNSRAFPCYSVGRGNEYDFVFDIQAPSYGTDTNLEVQMVRDGVAWFGETQRFPIKVASCGDACAQCILAARPDILPFYAANGWSTSCSNRNNIRNNWCGIDPTACNHLKAAQCKVECN